MTTETNDGGGVEKISDRFRRASDGGSVTFTCRYAGIYVDPWYGNIEIGNANNKLTIDFKFYSAHERHARSLAIRYFHHPFYR